MSTVARRFVTPLLVVTAAALLLPGFGCARWNWRGKGYDDDTDGRFGQTLRAPADPKKFTGLDARAQDIERNLGVR
jgi:hypothetical protein